MRACTPTFPLCLLLCVHLLLHAARAAAFQLARPTLWAGLLHLSLALPSLLCLAIADSNPPSSEPADSAMPPCALCTLPSAERTTLSRTSACSRRRRPWCACPPASIPSPCTSASGRSCTTMWGRRSRRCEGGGCPACAALTLRYSSVPKGLALACKLCTNADFPACCELCLVGGHHPSALPPGQPERPA